MIRLDAATVLLQWSVGGLFWMWVTTRTGKVGLGYSWLLRGIFGTIALAAALCGGLIELVVVREVSSGLVALVTAGALVGSIVRRRRGGVPVNVDLVAAAVGMVGLVAAGVAAGGPTALAIARTLVGAGFLGVVSDAMLLGHWYLVQPGLERRHLVDLVRWLAVVWPAEVLVLVWPTGMFSVLSGSVDDGWGGTLGWFWLACAVTTLVLTLVTRAALRERQYSAVMAATGLLYLAILTAFGTDLVARAVLTS